MVLELFIKTIFCTFWLITQEPLGLLKIYSFQGELHQNDHVLGALLKLLARSKNNLKKLNE